MNLMLHRPWFAVAVLAALLLLPGPLLLKLRLDNAPESYFPESAAAVQFDQSVREEFPEDQVLVALFAGEGVFDAAFLRALDTMTRQLEQSPLVERALSVTSVDHIRATADGFAVEPLLGPGQLSESAEENYERAVSDSLVAGALVAIDSYAHALVIRPAALEGSLQRLEVYNLLQSSISASGLDDKLIAIAGHVALDVEQLKAMIHDLATLIPGTLTISLVLLWWLFRRWLVLVLAGVTIGCVNGVALVALVLLDQPFTLITAMVPPLLTALNVAMLMHLFNAVCNADANGLTGEDRIQSALRAITKPILFTALTTCAGLLSLIASPIVPIATFGLVSAIATIVAAFLTVYVLPAILLKFDQKRWTQQSSSLRRLNGFTAALLRPALRRPVLVLAIGAAIILVSALQIPKIKVETDLYRFFADSHPINTATHAIEDRLSGVMPLEVVFTGASTDALKSPDRLNAVANVQTWLDKHPAVDHSISLPQMLAEMHAAFNGFPAGQRPLPNSAALVEQYLLFYDGRELDDIVNSAFTRTRILVNLNIHSAGALNDFLAELGERMASVPPADLEWDTAGMARLFADQERLLIQGQVSSLYWVGALITGLMLVLWRNITYTAISILPNFAPIILIFGLMGVFGIWLDMATAMVASVAIGIAIDDTIHLLHGVQQQLARGRHLTTAIARSVRHRGRAVVATTMILCSQFLLMAFSPFQPTAIFGILTAAGLVLALLFDLILLPALIRTCLREPTAKSS